MSGSKAPQSGRKGPPKAPPTPDQLAYLAKHMVRQQRIAECHRQDAEQRRRHPRLTVALDLAVGLPIIAAVIALFLAYFGVWRW